MFFYKKILVLEIIVIAIISFNFIKSENEFNNFKYEVQFERNSKGCKF